MKRFEVIVSVVIITVGVMCLAMSGSFMFQKDLSNFIKTFIQICVWMGIPLLLAGIIYLVFIRKRR